MRVENASAEDLKPTLPGILLERARKRYGKGITPCSGKNWGECFKDHGRYGYALYFNTSDGSTHIEREETL